MTEIIYKQHFPFRAIFIGALLSFFNAIGNIYNSIVIKGSMMALDFSTPAAIFFLFILVGIVNSTLKKVKPEIALSSSELLIIYAMLIISCAICTMGLTFYLLPLMVGPFYYATPENNWANLLHPHIKPWLTLQDKEAVRCFFEGLPKGSVVPYSAWLKPLSFWLIFLLALYFGMLCISSILRKQWVESERLIFPLTRIPLEMVEDDGKIFPPLFKNKLMWLGFMIPFFFGTLLALHHYFYFIPFVPILNQFILPICRGTSWITFTISFSMMGFAYLINTNLAFSIWFFHLIQQFVKGYFNITGIGLNENLDAYSAGGGGPIFSHIQFGAFLTLVIFGLWRARAHLKDVFRKAIKNDPRIEDSEEIISYRTSFFGLIFSFLVMSLWLRMVGLSFWLSLLFLIIAAIIFLGVSRIVAEGGVATTRAPLIPSTAVISGLGSSFLGARALMVLAYTHIWAGDVRTMVLTSSFHSLKLAESIKTKKRVLLWAMIISILVSIAGSIWMTLHLAYHYGGINASRWFFFDSPITSFNFIAEEIKHPKGPFIPGLVLTGLGALVMLGLSLGYFRFLWWPFHPLGFAICEIWLTSLIWFSVFLAWLVKTLLLRYGGAKAYNKGRAFFLGLIIGQFSVAGIWLIIDLFTGHTGNGLFNL